MAVANTCVEGDNNHLSNPHGREGSSSFACLHHLCEGICHAGGIGLLSFAALMEKRQAQDKNIPIDAIAVFVFHACTK
jgi:hypothetical protein